jgi:hypothetical protein
MKRASKAEEALKGEIKKLQLAVTDKIERRMLLQTEIDTLAATIASMERTVDGLKAARERASERQKKGP